MGIAVPIPQSIKERGVYQSLLKIARALQRTTIISIPATGTIAVTDDPTIPNTPNFVLLETFQVDTGIEYTDFIADENIYNFKAGVIQGDATFTPGDPNQPAFEVEVRVEPISLGDTSTVELEINVYTRGITAISNVVVEWKAQKLN